VKKEEVMLSCCPGKDRSVFFTIERLMRSAIPFGVIESSVSKIRKESATVLFCDQTIP
jgi:hypothetical protein